MSLFWKSYFWNSQWEHSPVPVLWWNRADGRECEEPHRAWHLSRAAGGAACQAIYPSSWTSLLLISRSGKFAFPLFDAKHLGRRLKRKQVGTHQSGKNILCMLLKLMFSISAKTQKRVWWLRPTWTGNANLKYDNSWCCFKSSLISSGNKSQFLKHEFGSTGQMALVNSFWGH